jgi:hypothetical protein
MFLLVFMVKISPENYTYVHETIKNNFFPEPIHTALPAKPLPYITMRPDNTLTPEERKEKAARWHLDSIYTATHPKPAQHNKFPVTTETGRIIKPGIDINSMPYQHVAETTAYQRQLLGFVSDHKAELPISSGYKNMGNKTGKAMGIAQTIDFFKEHPLKLIMGDGIGNFSSKLAFRASGIGLGGGYPPKLAYISPDFLSNHLDVYLNFFSKKTDYHSLISNPGSVYDQLLGEYGLIGVSGFLIWYLWYFIKHYKWLTYGWPILLLLAAILFTDYWFEQLSVLLFFELLLLLNIKELSTKTLPAHAN